jgi:hypothetical protein
MRRFRVFPFEGDDLLFSTVSGVTFAAGERARSFDFDERLLPHLRAVVAERGIDISHPDRAVLGEPVWPDVRR